MKKHFVLLFVAILSFLLMSCNTNSPDDGKIRLMVTPLEIIFPYDTQVHTAKIHVKSNTTWGLRNSGNMKLNVSQISGSGDATIVISEQMPASQKTPCHNQITIYCQDGTKEGIQWYVEVYRDGETFKW